MTMLRAGGLLDVLTPLSDCRHETVERIMERRIFGGFMYVLDEFPQLDFVLWAFICPINVTSILLLFCLYFVASILCLSSLSFRLPRRGLPRLILTTTGYDACCVYIPAITPQYIPTPWLSHQSYHAPPHSYIGLPHPPYIVVRILQFTFHRLLRHLFFSTYTTTGRHTYQPTPHPTSCSDICSLRLRVVLG